MRNTVKTRAKKAPILSSRPKVSSKTKSILNRLRSKQRKTLKSSKPSAKKPGEWSELLTLQEHSIRHSLHIHRSAQRLLRVEYTLRKLLEAIERLQPWEITIVELKPVIATYPNELPALPNV